jgi:cytochrome c peroxidase
LNVLQLDFCTRRPTDIFSVGGINVRKVEPRNTPTIINAVFNFDNFWDGRAKNIFNGVNPFGARDPNARIFKKNANGQDDPVTLRLKNSSLASQAVGPPLSDFEMSCGGRTFADNGRKVLGKQPLALQMVASGAAQGGDDSVLGPERNPSGGLGLKGTYADLVKAAFHPVWTDSTEKDINGFTQMERNFSLFWGLAIQAFESTLISDKAPFDKWVEAGKPPQGISGFGAAEIRGLEIFTGQHIITPATTPIPNGKCINCHGGPEFSNAATHLQPENQENGLVERMIMRDDCIALYDNGFYNIGVVPTAFDIGRGGKDPFGNPL